MGERTEKRTPGRTHALYWLAIVVVALCGWAIGRSSAPRVEAAEAAMPVAARDLVPDEGAIAPVEDASTPTPTTVPPTPTALPTVTPTPVPESMVQLGPTGAWPDHLGFPSYDSTATIVTDGTLAGLRSAIDELAESGGLIEHAGDLVDVDDAGLSRDGAAPIVIRPPLGQRSEFTISGTLFLRGDGLLVAGFNHGGGAIYPVDVVNSGAAWIESDRDGEFRVLARGETERTVVGLWYEAVYRNYVLDVGYDRSAVNAIAADAEAHLDATGLWLAGHARPVGSAAHVDTIQLVGTDGGVAGASIRNSVVWPSSNVALQGSGDRGFRIVGSWIAEPEIGLRLFEGALPADALDGHGAITGKAEISGSIVLGNTHPNSIVTVESTSHYGLGDTYIDNGDNLALDSPDQQQPPDPPTHEELDGLWHP